MKEIVADKSLIAYCGLYCGACGKYLKGSCNGCQKNEKATWCGVRKCCIENSYSSCADCKLIELKDCKKFNNFISKIFGFVFSSSRSACIACIKSKDYEEYAKYMTENKKMTNK